MTAALAKCCDCGSAFDAGEPPLGGWLPGDMRRDYCRDCRPAILAERDQLYAQATAKNRAECEQVGHATLVDHWQSLGIGADSTNPAHWFCNRCGEDTRPTGA